MPKQTDSQSDTTRTLLQQDKFNTLLLPSSQINMAWKTLRSDIKRRLQFAQKIAQMSYKALGYPLSFSYILTYIFHAAATTLQTDLHYTLEYPKYYA